MNIDVLKLHCGGCKQQKITDFKGKFVEAKPDTELKDDEELVWICDACINTRTYLPYQSLPHNDFQNEKCCFCGAKIDSEKKKRIKQVRKKTKQQNSGMFRCAFFVFFCSEFLSLVCVRVFFCFFGYFLLKTCKVV